MDERGSNNEREARWRALKGGSRGSQRGSVSVPGVGKEGGMRVSRVGDGEEEEERASSVGNGTRESLGKEKRGVERRWRLRVGYRVGDKQTAKRKRNWRRDIARLIR